MNIENGADFYAGVGDELKDMRSGRLRLCNDCGNDRGIVKMGENGGIPIWRCIDCVPDEQLHPGRYSEQV